MIESICGRLVEADSESVVLATGGLAFRLTVPAPLAQELAPLIGTSSGASVCLHAHLLLRPDSWQLFGFSDQESRRLFRILLAIPGVGPRMAISLLSHLAVAEIGRAVESQDARRFEVVPGIGKRIAGRIVHELSGKISGPESAVAPPLEGVPGGTAASDAIGALVALGLSHPEAVRMVQAALRTGADGGDSAALVAEALRQRQRAR